MKFINLLQVAFFLAFTLMFSSCEKNEITSRETEKYIDLDITKPFCEFSSDDENLYFEARERFGNFVKLQDGNYILNEKCNAESLHMTAAMFDHFKNILEQTNEELKSLQTWEYQEGKLILVSDNFVFYSPLKTRAIEQGGITQVEVYWYGYDFYISNADLHRIAAGATLVTIFSALIPDPTVSKIAAVLAGLCALAAGELEYYYPDGVIISVTQPVPGMGCIPYNLQGQ